MPKFKSLDSFSPTQEENKNIPKSLNPTTFVIKNKNQSSWVRKDLGEKYSEALEETVAQEFFRLICPFYPKTRWAKENKEYYVLSKEIPKFDAYFFSRFKGEEAIASKNLTGLASAQVLSLLLNEVDFRPGNVGVDVQYRVIKIDGGLCFAEEKGNYNDLFKGKNYNITKKDIKALPVIFDYQASNWLDLIEWNVKEECSTISPNSMLNELSEDLLVLFRKERNQTLLSICLLPEELIQYFTQAYIEEGRIAGKLTDIIINRKKQLQESVSQDESFQAYKSSDEAQEDIVNFIRDLKSFKTMGKSVLLTDFKQDQGYDVEEHIFKKFIKGYSAIKNFFTQLNSSDLENDESISHLREIINEYFEQPTINRRKALCLTLGDVRENLVTDLKLPQDAPLISSIDKLIKQLNTFEKGAPIPPPRKVSSENNTSCLFKEKKKLLTCSSSDLIGQLPVYQK